MSIGSSSIFPGFLGKQTPDPWQMRFADLLEYYLIRRIRGQKRLVWGLNPEPTDQQPGIITITQKNQV